MVSGVIVAAQQHMRHVRGLSVYMALIFKKKTCRGSLLALGTITGSSKLEVLTCMSFINGNPMQLSQFLRSKIYLIFFFKRKICFHKKGKNLDPIKSCKFQRLGNYQQNKAARDMSDKL